MPILNFMTTTLLTNASLSATYFTAAAPTDPVLKPDLQNLLNAHTSSFYDGSFVIAALHPNSSWGSLTNSTVSGYATTLGSHAGTLSSHDSLLTSHTSTLASHLTTLNSHGGTLTTHGTRLDGHDTTLTNQQGSIDGQAGTIAGHTATLASHASSLSSHASTLSTHGTQLNFMSNDGYTYNGNNWKGLDYNYVVSQLGASAALDLTNLILSNSAKLGTRSVSQVLGAIDTHTTDISGLTTGLQTVKDTTVVKLSQVTGGFHIIPGQ